MPKGADSYKSMTALYATEVGGVNFIRECYTVAGSGASRGFLDSSKGFYGLLIQKRLPKLKPILIGVLFV